jgi:hypothetical protein
MAATTTTTTTAAATTKLGRERRRRRRKKGRKKIKGAFSCPISLFHPTAACTNIHMCPKLILFYFI